MTETHVKIEWVLNVIMIIIHFFDIMIPSLMDEMN